MKNNNLIVEDTIYTLTDAYRKGALAMRGGTPYNVGNPYSSNSQSYSDWNDGHANESDDLHTIADVDVILAPRKGNTFESASV